MNPQYGRTVEAARLADEEARRVHGEPQPSWLDHFLGFAAPAGPPPRPAAPSVAPEAWDHARINTLKVRQVANIVANENHDVTPGKSAPGDLQKAKIAQAHAIMNADRMYGKRRQQVAHTASDVVTANLENSEQYRQALDAARTAFEEQLAGKDPTGGRVFFNHRTNSSTAPRLVGDQKVNVYKQFGPFALGSRTRFTIINDNPKRMPKSR